MGGHIEGLPKKGIAEQKTPFLSQLKSKDFPFTQTTSNNLPWLKSFSVLTHHCTLSFTGIL